ncbi:receptor like protein 22-like [Triticum urartu]|uniref:receptor like protein 22-like n=1 Tax=Triticum urartu TaxID=4572 RepID=UPI002042DC9F|nr:receptor like protein 22-like [Triticum urartu]
MASIGWVLLLFIAELSALATSGAHGDGNFTLRCQPDQAASLLQLKKSFSFFHYPSALESWQDGTDCCLWEGVGCSNSSGHVTALELSGHGLYSQGINPAIFNLTSLQLLDLSMNYFGEYSLLQFRFERLPLLTHLNLSHLGFQGQIPTGIGGLTNLISLDLSANYDLGDVSTYDIITGDRNNVLYLQDPNFKILVANLNNLRELYLDGVDMSSSGEWCHALAKSLPRLQVLSLSYCKLVGPICPSLSNLHSLTVINLEGNFGIPTALAPFPEFFMDFLNLSVLRLAATNLQGWFPRRTFQSKTLRVLDLSWNQDLSGPLPNFSNTSELPASVFTIPTLQRLDIRSSKISGSIQDINATSSHLVSVDLSRNNLMGNIPKSFFQLTSLAYLDICWNNLMGSVDLSSFWRLQNLVHLGLSNSNLSVTDIYGEGNNSLCTYLPRVTRLELASCNLTGFPCSLAPLNQMSYLDLSCNRISGAIPKWIWSTWNSSLRYLNLSHNMFSIMQVPSYVLPFYKLGVLDISSNQLQGQIPMPSPSAFFLDYSNNNFSSLPPNFTLYLGFQFKISKNNISGHIPNSICDSRTSVLDLSFNSFSGWIPPCLIQEGSMSVLSLRENQFEGVLPNIIKDRCVLQILDLNNNKIEGQLPKTLTKCLQLEFLDIGNNHMVGTFPSWLGVLSGLRVLVLRSNRFYGSMGGDLHSDEKSGEYFFSLQILDVASNNFFGNLSPEWFDGLKSMMNELNTTGDILGDNNSSDSGMEAEASYQDTVTIYYKSIYRTFDKVLSTLTVIDLSNNSFGGTIPGSLGRLTSLHVLNMSGNAFTGDIPQVFGRMTQLESLDLSQNQLSGDIPEALTNLTFLGILNLSNNQLVGRIPQSGQFATFQNSSFEGNLGLCGPPLPNPCGISPAPPSTAHADDSSHVDVVLFLSSGFGFGVGFAAAILMRWGRIGKWFLKSARALRT